MSDCEVSRRGRITKVFTFCASHHLPLAPIGHKCANLHGHNYEVEVEAEGHIDMSRGWVVDFEAIKQAAKPLVDQLDHANLNDHLENPTAELLALWFLERLPDWVTAVRIKETPETMAEVCR